MEFQASNTLYKLLFDNANDGILLADLDSKRFYIGNKTICKMLGYSLEEIKNLGVGDIHPKKDLPYVLEQFEKQSRGKIGENILAKDMPVKRKDGNVFYADISASRLKFAGKMCLLGIFRDATERKRVEKDLENAKIAARNVAEDVQIEKENLARAKAMDEAMLLSIGDGIIATGQDRNVILVNKSAEKLLGVKKEEIIGKKWPDVASPVDDEGMVPLEKSPVQMTLESGKTINATTGYYYHNQKGKRKFPVAITASPIKTGNKFLGAIEVFHDISHEREIDEMKTEFISVASHQLRTPMVGIQWVIERLLKKEKLSEKGKEYLDDIHSSIWRLSNLVDLLLNVSRIEEGGISISLQPLEIIGFIKNCLEENEPIRVKKNLSINFKEHPEKLAIITDCSALKNIIQILVFNAMEYTPNNGRVDIFLEREDGTLLFKVRDTGIGIPQKEQKIIFKKFTRCSNAKLFKTDGTGLGLYSAKQAAELLGGKIWFESAGEGKGTTFFVQLPVESKVKKAGKKFA